MAWKDILSGMGKAFGPVLDFIDEHPGTAAAIAGGIASMFTPDEADIERERLKLKEEYDARERARREGNLMVGDVNLGMEPSKAKQLLHSDGTPVYPVQMLQQGRGGFLARSMRGG